MADSLMCDVLPGAILLDVWQLDSGYGLNQVFPLLETNMALGNGWLEDDFPFGKARFQGQTVRFKDGGMDDP